MLYKIGDIIINLKNVTMIKNCKYIGLFWEEMNYFIYNR